MLSLGTFTHMTKTTCSECFIDLIIDLDAGVVRATIPSNGRRGSLHVPAHDVEADLTVDEGTDLIMWDCPACGHADSFDPHS